MPSAMDRATRACALLLACLVALLPAGAAARARTLLPPGAVALAAATEEPPAPTVAGARVAVVITQAVGVGALADRIASLAIDALYDAGASALDPAAASASLREAGAPDPLTCGTDARCLEAIAQALDVRWVLAIGVGRFAGMYSLDLRLFDRQGEGRPASTSGTWAEPGPDWEEAIDQGLSTLLPAELLQQTGRLLVRANVPATLRIDGAPSGDLPMAEPIELAPGVYQVEIENEGSRTGAEVEIVANQEATLDLVLAPSLAGSGTDWMETGSWIAGGGALVTLVAAVATHAAAGSTMDDARSQKDAGKPFLDTRADAIDQVQTARVLYGLAGGLAVGAAVLWLLGGDAPAMAAPPAQELP